MCELASVDGGWCTVVCVQCCTDQALSPSTQQTHGRSAVRFDAANTALIFSLFVDCASTGNGLGIVQRGVVCVQLSTSSSAVCTDTVTISLIFFVYLLTVPVLKMDEG